jgi:hypothetical protein
MVDFGALHDRDVQQGVGTRYCEWVHVAAYIVELGICRSATAPKTAERTAYL